MLKRLGLLLAVALLLAGCTGTPAVAPTAVPPTAAPSAAGPGTSAAPSASAQGYAFTDDAGRVVALPESPRSVVTLFGSYGDVWQLAGGQLSGATDDFVSERSGDAALSCRTEIIGTVKHPNAEAILALTPDLVLLSCDIDSHADMAQTLGQAGVPCAFFKVEVFQDYLRMLDICTDITGRKDLYEQNGLAIQRAIQGTLDAVPREGGKPTVLLIRALSTKAKALSQDNMVCAMLEDLGADNIASRHPSLLEDLSMEDILVEDPDFILVVTMGEEGAALDALAAGIQANPAWASLTAVQEGRYLVLPKALFHYKPNARWGESYDYLARLLYPDAFEPAS